MYQTIDEINRDYNGQWVFVIENEEGDNYHIKGGVVAAYAADADALMEKADEVDPAKCLGGGPNAYFYAGDKDDGIGLLL